MRNLFAIVFGAFVLLAFSQVEAQSLSDSATSTVDVAQDGDIVTVHAVNRSYQCLGIYERERDGYRHLILRKTEEGTVSNNADGTADSHVRLEVLEVDTDSLVPLYVIEDQGEEGHVETYGFFQTFFTTVRWGCCGALNTLRTYSLLSGRELFSATYPPAWFEAPNSGGIVGLAAIHTIYSMDDDVLFGDRPDALAQLTLATKEMPLQRLLIVMTEQLMGVEIDYPEPSLAWAEGDEAPASEITAWTAEGVQDFDAIAGLTLVVEFTPRLVIRLPLVEGRLSLETAEVPPGLTLEELPLE